MRKKFPVIFLSFMLVVSMMPLSIFAGTGLVGDTENEGPEYGTHEYWEELYPNQVHTYSLHPGEKIGSNAGTPTIFIDEDITIQATEAGQSGLVIDGDATIILVDGCNLTVTGSDAKGLIGGGAGIELTQGNSLWVKGTGKLIANGGGNAAGMSGENGGDASKNKSGTGGAGGNGGGGAGAAIGSKGGKATVGGAETEGKTETWTGLESDPGNHGIKSADSEPTEAFGQLKVSGCVEVETNTKVIADKNCAESQGGLSKYDSHILSTTSLGGGGGGGNGGNGYLGATFGSGGVGGTGGGSGGSGGICNHFEQGKATEEHPREYPAGGGGSYGQGYNTHTYFIRHGGEWKYPPSQWTDRSGGMVKESTYGQGGYGAKGSSCGTSGDASSIVYATTLKDAEAVTKTNSGKTATIYQAYPIDECQIMIKDHVLSVVHIPTGTVLEKDKDYSLEISKDNNSNKYNVKASGGRLVDFATTNEGSLRNEYQAASYTVKCFLQDLTLDGKATESYTCDENSEEQFDGIVNTLTQAKSKEYEGFTAKKIVQKPINENGDTTIEVYYDRDKYNVTLKGGDHSGWTEKTQKIAVPYGAKIEKYLPEGYDLAEPGYSFEGWTPALTSDAVMDNKDLTFKALWSLNPKGTYHVTEYAQEMTLNGEPTETYETIGSYSRTGHIGALTDIEPNELLGFTAQPVEQKTIEEDGSTEVAIYYKRNVHNVTFNLGECSGLTNSVITVPVCYGAPITKFVPVGYDLAIDGYEFDGWEPGLYDTTKMGDEDVEFTAKWIKLAPTTYTERIFAQDLSSDEKTVADTYSLLSEETRGGYVGKMTSVNPEIEGFHAKAFEQKVIQENGETVVEVYMDRDAYDLDLVFTYGSAICAKEGVSQKTIPVKMYYGASIEKNMPAGYLSSRSGYRFVGFTPRINVKEKASPETLPSSQIIVGFSGAY